ncbi:MAG TPA: DUF998 domain-containing protein [Candidatus Dormibacteraeota bacterium]|nr:DUF998 domain-containing protein [Candidatus Dormibacteraeota bacterium]
MARSSANPYHGSRGAALARLAAWAGVACPLAVAAVLGAAGWLSPRYDPVRTTLSHLGQRGQPFALEVNLSFAALGLTYVAVGWALGRSLGRPGWSGAVVLTVAGLALVGVALVSRDPVHPVPHRAVALVLFLALAVAPLLVAAPLRASPRWRRHGVLSVAVVAASFVLLVIGVGGVVHGGLPAGAWERLYTAVNLVWLTALAAGLLRE